MDMFSAQLASCVAVKQALAARQASPFASDACLRECVKHLSFALQKAKTFVAREDLIGTMNELCTHALTSGERSAPIVCAGASGEHCCFAVALLAR